ncbi:MAG TPA: ankyrin repeat domain-containing protein [Armatimonadota bacterium]|jgi:ankyrin repeat protein
MPSTEDLIAAIHLGDTETVESLLLIDPTLAESRNGLSPILAALYDRQDDILEMLLNELPLLTVSEAAALGQVDALKALLQGHAADANLLSGDGWTPLHLACFFNEPLVVEVLLEMGADTEIVSANPTAVTPLQSALAAGAEGIARNLIEHGANIHLSGWSPLHYAAANNLPDTAEYLIARGADINALNPDNETPLALAQRSGNLETAAILSMHGARA